MSLDKEELLDVIETLYEFSDGPQIYRLARICTTLLFDSDDELDDPYPEIYIVIRKFVIEMCKMADTLDTLVYNSHYRSIKMTPVEASNEDNVSKGFKNLFRPKAVGNPKFAIGDKVRISIYKQPFRKGYLQTFTEELFKISQVLDTEQPFNWTPNNRWTPFNSWIDAKNYHF